MIELHRLTHPEHPFFLNPDKIISIEANPDTVVSLDDGAKYVVNETPQQITAEIREWRASILGQASLDRGFLHRVS